MVSVETSNDAFRRGQENVELARVLRTIADVLEERGIDGGGLTLFDINGGRCGAAGWLPAAYEEDAG